MRQGLLYYITKIIPTAQQVDDREKFNIFNKFFPSSQPNFTAELAIHKEKNLCHQQWQQSNENLACFSDIIMFSLLNN